MKKLFTIAFLLLISALFTFGQNDNVKAIKKDINQPSAVNATTYDFTTGADKYYGGSAAAVQLETGVWGMIAGDANQDGVVDAVDKNSYWRVENGTTYDYSKNSDFNLDGNLDAVDKNSYWRPNNGKSSQVPN